MATITSESAEFRTRDGRTLTITATLKPGAMWPTLTHTMDGQPVRFDTDMVTVKTWQAINRQVCAWTETAR
ncbi:hypothetical protein ACH4T9_12905 [Micromonospora sp. NPDC020750]|uniref:hypothetical protein n=1 Tax=unclassified Micromonospora TaxID=2617518 RepID=UPI0037B259D9